MTRLILAAGVAALAITAPAASQPGDRGGGKDRATQVQKGERGKARAQRVERKQAVQKQRAKAREQRANRTERVQERRAQRAERVRDVREQRANRAERVREQRVDRRPAVRERVLERRANIAERQSRQLERIAERRGFRLERRADLGDRQLARLAERNVLRVNDWEDLARGGIWLNGCPPGLAKLNRVIPCVPPGQVKNFLGEPVSVLGNRMQLRELPQRLRMIYPDNDAFYHRFGSGYVYRVNRETDLISALLPLFGLGLTVGQPFPMAYSSHYLPAGLQPFYASTSQDYFRYANGYVYEIDGRTGLIEDVDPLLGYGYGYGQMMPLTYSAYNVPYQYRPLYYDTSDAYYRYAPGAIYQVDPTTSLITAVAALLTGGMTVGQPLPMGYSTYNVPMAYRATYYDTPDASYRYNNGHIYRVDPTTQLVTAIVASILT